MGFLFKDKEPVKKTAPGTYTMPSTIGPVRVNTPIPGGTDYNKYLDDVMRKNNQPGLDYLEFADALQRIDSQPLSEAQKYIVTYPSYESSGVSVEKLVNSANQYISLLDKEAADFAKEMTASKQTGINAPTQNIATMQQEIETLTKQIQDKSAKILQLREHINSTTNELAAAENNFNVALSLKKSLITEHISKIQNYLSNVTKR